MEPKAGQWDYAGQCDPLRKGGGLHSASISTFSLGIFQWIPKANGKGLKRGSVVRRVKGYMSIPEKAHAEAQACVDLYNAQDRSTKQEGPMSDQETLPSEQMCDWDEKHYKCKVHPTCEATRKHVRSLLERLEVAEQEVLRIKGFMGDASPKTAKVYRETMQENERLRAQIKGRGQ